MCSLVVVGGSLHSLLFIDTLFNKDFFFYMLCHANQRMVRGFQSQATMQCDQRYSIFIAFLEKHKVMSSKKNLPRYSKVFCELLHKKYRMEGVKFLQGRFHFLLICMWRYANGCWKTHLLLEDLLTCFSCYLGILNAEAPTRVQFITITCDGFRMLYKYFLLT